jgi:aminodeoxyfutalosine deaminase
MSLWLIVPLFCYPSKMPPLPASIAALPKAELHLHLEGSVQPATMVALARRHSVVVTEDEVRRYYDYQDFYGFLEVFKWVTSYLRDPQDYALIAHDLGEELLRQNVVYTEITLSVGVMLLRKQSPEANFAAILAAAEAFEQRGLHMNWIFDAVRQFGADPAMRVVESAQRCASKSIVAFGIGGDELSVPTREFRPVYDQAANIGLHRLMHAGEVGGPDKIREAVELLGAERIGHGIAAIHDPALMDLLADRRVPLEICPQSNIRTGALARQLSGATATAASTEKRAAGIEHHPLPKLFRHGIPIVLSTDDPAMFHTSLLDEYRHAASMGVTEPELARLAEMSFAHAFAVPASRSAGLATAT